LLQCRNVMRSARRKVVAHCRRRRFARYLIVAMGTAVMMLLWIADENATLRDETYGTLRQVLSLGFFLFV